MREGYDKIRSSFKTKKRAPRQCPTWAASSYSSLAKDISHISHALSVLRLNSDTVFLKKACVPGLALFLQLFRSFDILTSASYRLKSENLRLILTHRCQSHIRISEDLRRRHLCIPETWDSRLRASRRNCTAIRALSAAKSVVGVSRSLTSTLLLKNRHPC